MKSLKVEVLIYKFNHLTAYCCLIVLFSVLSFKFIQCKITMDSAYKSYNKYIMQWSIQKGF